MNLFSLATRGVDLDALPTEEPARETLTFNPGRSVTVPSELDRVFADAGDAYGVDPAILKSIALTESGFSPEVITGQRKSSAGALGLMQFMPNTAKEYGIDPLNPVEAIFGAAAYMRQSLDKFGGDYGKAVASYNAGRNRKDFDAEDWDQRMPAETQGYLMKVFGSVDQFKTPQAAPAPDTGDETARLAARYKAPKLERTWGEAVSDTLVQLGEGSANVVGAIPNLVAPDSDVARAIKDVGQGYRDKQSEALKQRSSTASQAIDKAGEDGVIAQVVEAAKQYSSDPALAARFVTTNLASLFPGIGAAKLAQAAALARGASAVSAAATATTTAGGVNAVMNAGGARGEAFDDLKSTLMKQGMSEAQATEKALTGSLLPAAVGGVAGFVSGKTGLEGAIVGKAGAKAAVTAGVKSSAVELGGEQFEELAPKLATNYQAGQYDNRPLTQDVGRTIVETAIGSGPGSIYSGVQAGINAKQSPTVESQPTTPQAPTVTPQAPVTPDAAKTQAVDNIAAAIKELEGGTTQTAPVQPGSQAADVGAAPVAQGPEGANEGSGYAGTAAATGQSESAQSLKATSYAQRTATPTPLPGAVPSTTSADAGVRAMVEGIKQKRAQDAEETAQIQQMLAEDDAKAAAMVASSVAETARGQAAQIAMQSRARLVDDLVSSYAEPSDFFASRVLPAVDKQLAVLGRPPLAPEERRRIDSLLGSTRAFIRPSLPSDTEAASAFLDVGADNASMESLIKEKQPKPAATGLAAEMAALKARSNKPRQNKAPKPLLTDGERDMLADFERMYQADVKGEIKTRLGLLPARQDEATAPAERRKPSELLAAIKRAGGIKSTNAGDLMGGSAMDANRILPGLFTKGGMNLDLLVPFLKERGYLKQADEDSIKDNGGVNKLAEILQAELSGARAQTMDSTAGFESDADNAMRSQLDSKAFALGLPMKVTNEMSTERLNGVINRIERKLGKPVNTDFATRKMNRTEAMAERQAILMADRVERARAQYDADIQAFAEADDAVQDAVLEIATDADGNVDIVYTRAVDAASAADALNGQWSDQNAEIDTSRAGASQENSGQAGAPVAQGARTGSGNPEANRTETGAGEEGIRRSVAPAAQAEATAKRAEEAAARAEAAAKQASEIAQRSVAAADTFEPGGNAEDNLSGQEGFKFSFAGARAATAGRMSLMTAQDAATTAQPLRTPAATIRAAITKAYGNLLDKLEAKGLVTIAQTEREAIEAAAQARADKTGGDVEQIKRQMLASVQMQRVWHGSPHRGIQQFSTDKIGTGEGAQAYGWGLYFANKKEIAEHYRNGLSKQAITIDGESMQARKGGRLAGFAREKGLSPEDAFALNDVLNNFFTNRYAKSIDDALKNWRDDNQDEETAKRVEALKGRVEITTGQLYEVEIPEDSDMLLWDKPLSEQPAVVKASAKTLKGDIASDWLENELDRLNADWNELTGQELYKLVQRALVDDALVPNTGSVAEQALIEGKTDKAASMLMMDDGIKGIKYLDGTSRNAGDGSYNYVIFDGADTEIVDVKYSANGNIEGFFDKQTGKSFLVADNLTAASAPGTLMHEVGIHMAADGKLEPLFKRAGSLLKTGTQNEFIQRVQARMDQAGETSNEEAAAYIVTEYENDRAAAPDSVVKWVKDFIADVRAWLFGKGVLLKADQLTVADIAAVARANARGMAKGAESADANIKASRSAAQSQLLQQQTPQTPQQQPLSKWRDSTGRFQFAPGAMLYDFIGAKASPLLSYMGLKAASPELRTQLRRMKAEVAKAQEVAAKVATESAKFSEAERAMVSDLVEKTVAAGTIPPDHAVKMAELINTVMGKQTDELVALGMMEKDSADRWRGQYLPRYYESKLLKKDAWTEAMTSMMRRASLMRGIKGKHLKGRGLFESVPVEQQADYEALGWEVRDSSFNPENDKTVMMWRDFTSEERANMGEIRDAGFRFVMGYMQTQKDLALGRMYRSIAQDENLSSRTPTDTMTVKVPDTKVKDIAVNVYGELAGRYVSRETLSALSSQAEAQSDVLAAYRKALGLWKEGKTVLNPVSHLNNVVSNITMAHFAGVSYHRGDKYIAAITDLVKGSAMVKEAKVAGLFSGGFSETELMQSMPEELKALAGNAESRADKAINTAMQVMTFGLRNKMQNAYGFEDDFFKYLIYKDARSRGTSPDEAIDFAQRYIFTYDDLPKGARIIRDSALPFFSYTYKAVPALLHTALTQPHRFAVPAALTYAAASAAYAIAAGDDDDDWYESIEKYLLDEDFRNKAEAMREDDQKRLPPWMKGYMWTLGGVPRAIRVGYDKEFDLPVFFDISRMMPGGTLIDVSPNAGGVPLFEGITPSHPLLSIGTAMLGNRDLFTGKDVVDKTDDRWEAAGKRADWMWKQLSPAITIGNYHYERVMNMVAQQTGEFSVVKDYTGVDRMGMPTLPQYGIPQTFGLKIKPVDLDLSEEISRGQNAKLIREIDAEVRALQRLHSKGNVSAQTMEREREKAAEKKQRLREGLTVDGDKR